MVGRKLGQYRLLEHLASGGMGAVYRAVDETLDREVALKLFDADLNDLERFRTEATTIARFNHPGIATVYELFQEDEHWVMVMEFIRGETLEQLLDHLGPLTAERAAEVCMQALTALAYSHQMGVIHRDLKPSNLMITPSGIVKIMDFGVARVMGSAHRTHAGFTMGTPAYMAPEQVKGEPLDARTDLYAMGVILFRLLTGTLPFDGRTPFAVAHSHVSDTPRAVRQLNPRLPEWTEQVVTRALAKSPDDRFQSADEFRLALRRSPARPVSPRADLSHHDATEPLSVIAPRRDPGRDVARWSTLAAAIFVVGAIGMSTSWRPPVKRTDPPAARHDRLSGSALPISAYGSLAPALTGLGIVPKPAEPDGATVSAPVVMDDVTVASAFSGVKLFMTDRERAGNRDVVMHFSTDRLTLLPDDGGPPILTFPYRDIQQTTYLHARDPQWESSLGSPPAKIGAAGLLSRARHWFVVQTKDSYAILQLDGDQWSNIVQTFERRTGLTVARPANGKN
ncbi:MAG TPA: serine/threonine-protein kinase [Vicinamibacterales bacterium]